MAKVPGEGLHQMAVEYSVDQLREGRSAVVKELGRDQVEYAVVLHHSDRIVVSADLLEQTLKSELEIEELLAAIEPHRQDEVYVVIAGSAVLEVDGERTPVSVGSVAYVPAGCPHRFVEAGDDLRVFVVFAPPET